MLTGVTYRSAGNSDAGHAELPVALLADRDVGELSSVVVGVHAAERQLSAQLGVRVTAG